MIIKFKIMKHLEHEIEDLEKAFKSIEDGTADLIPWENKDPMAIINLIDNFIKQNWN